MPLLQRKTLTIILAVVLIWLGYEIWQIRDQRIAMRVQVKDLESRATDLENNNKFLASSSAYFASDAYLERQARIKLNYKLPDEQVAFVYKDTSVKVASPSKEFQVRLSEMPNWQKWWYYLLGY